MRGLTSRVAPSAAVHRGGELRRGQRRQLESSQAAIARMQVEFHGQALAPLRQFPEGQLATLQEHSPRIQA
ncbi:hypothetical protein G039_0320045 [Pseudomonas aeruginosa VRFPA01]|nr:hypothetical protein G039_0320045 [Pseudomonas aeruginosa VRFPA01]